ncbi:hypothetical protein RM543_12725 [Roseicyclus sp. F158]|uniref:CD-NTase-associated protein 15 domain-containing protein n=1 Tax=Tropicimonas omnivorans TaxID=3075590 RepID=A0ABU3DIL1_9RHOB|nr:hypothetical protein [Roseicyclus sp. F158]MDT0683554.1 hypothetical protein [Roseicyclus sp. F158]
MYPLLPWKWIGGGLTLVTMVAVYAGEVQRLTGVPIPDRYVVRYLPLGVLLILGGFFGPTCYWAPWRILWRWIPKLNDLFPDLNGVWVGSTSSNWPTIKRLVEAAQSDDRTTEQELHDLPEQQDAMAVRFTNSLFKLQMRAGLSSTNGESFSITAKPWRNQNTGRIHLSYVYRQQTPNHAITDEQAHLGAADLELVTEDYRRAEGTYWTRRAWRTGRNTAGILELSKVTAKEGYEKSLQHYAQEHKPIFAK